MSIQQTKKVAWHVTDYECTENQAVIVFDETEQGAKQLAKEKLGEYEDDELEVTRMEKYDLFAGQGYVEPIILLFDGWWFECSGEVCGKEISLKTKTPQDLQRVITEGSNIWCCERCKQDLPLVKRLDNDSSKPCINFGSMSDLQFFIKLLDCSESLYNEYTQLKAANEGIPRYSEPNLEAALKHAKVRIKKMKTKDALVDEQWKLIKILFDKYEADVGVSFK
ncbi:hypothetical protein [Zooshikella sp. RANM57]|uniref:hypothetical protein n=1 Tax=Zooshikella sp. RANM57 TaxID=3425863 RepID=UPI003D6E97A1